MAKTEQLTKIHLDRRREQRGAQRFYREGSHTQDLAIVCWAGGHVSFQRSQDSNEQGLDGRVPPLDFKGHRSNEDPIGRLQPESLTQGCNAFCDSRLARQLCLDVRCKAPTDCARDFTR
jgi:hypothetical protein